jgi:hypothetical protein
MSSIPGLENMLSSRAEQAAAAAGSSSHAPGYVLVLGLCITVVAMQCKVV